MNEAIPIAFALLCCAMTVPAATFHVSPKGDDGNPGTSRKPFASLARARQAARDAGSGKREVVVHAGVYELTDTFRLEERDSGTERVPVVWRAADNEEARLVGGRSVPSSAFRSVDDAATLGRLAAPAREHVVVADLGVLGIPIPPQLPIKYHGAPPGPELFLNGDRMALAHWPNEGWATIAKIVDTGSRPREGDTSNRPGIFEYSGDEPSRWNVANGVWLQGYWCYDWYDEVIKVASVDASSRRITLAAPHLYSIMQGNPSPRRYRALNLLEELDSPGEFYIDRSSGKLYLWPPTDSVRTQVTLSTLAGPIVALENASHVTLRGFVVECGQGDGVSIEGGSDCRIEACDVRNLRQIGIRVQGGTKHRVEACDIHETGTGGLVLAGGDRKTLTPGGHLALNNHIWRVSVHQPTGSYAIVFGGVGNRAANNLIEDIPHQAVLVGGNDHVFEYNEVRNACTETDDCGALYKGRNPSCRGNQIRFNYWHDIGKPMGHGNAAVYFDDGDGGDTVYGNVFVRCGEPGKGSFGTVFSHGGHDNIAENNIFVDCKRALGSAPWSETRWLAALKGAEETLYPEKLLQEVDITTPPYTDRYPELIGFMNPPAGAKRVNHARRNVLVRCGQTATGNWEFADSDMLILDRDPGFENWQKGDFRLKTDSEVFRRLPGFKRIPFEKVGLKKDRLRRRLRTSSK